MEGAMRKLPAFSRLEFTAALIPLECPQARLRVMPTPDRVMNILNELYGHTN
jgi:hypothetical protein